jgi:5'(3')-deoxyribonucleotidase
MIIAVDIDDTVACLIDRWLGLYNAEFNDTKTSADITRWEISQCVKPECGSKIWKYLELPTLYDEVRPMPGALEGVALLRTAGHRVVFVTSCGKNASTIARAGDKFQWLVRNGFLEVKEPYLDFIVCADKTQVAADIIIDDRADTVSAWVEAGRAAILVSRPHNRSSASLDVIRAGSWRDITLMVDDHVLKRALLTAPVMEAKPKTVLPTDAATRKGIPIFTGVIDYFPNALAEIAAVSKAGNDQHNPGQPLHWARGKSMDHVDTAVRHMMERGTRDTDGMRHMAKAAWRCLAELQQECERDGAPVSRGSR